MIPPQHDETNASVARLVEQTVHQPPPETKSRTMVQGVPLPVYAKPLAVMDEDQQSSRIRRRSLT